MRVAFQETPWDLYLVVLYTFVAAGVLLALASGSLLAVALVLFAPGYLVLAALYPRAGEMGWTERLVFSVGASLAVVPLLALLLTFTPYGVRFAPLVATVTTFTGLVALAAYTRRMRVPATERLSLSLGLTLPRGHDLGPLDRALSLGVIASVLVAAAALGYVLLVPRPGERFSELYIQGPGGNATGYPSLLNLSQPATVLVGVVDHEEATLAYTLRVDLVGVAFVYNASLEANVTVELNRTALSWFNFTLGDSSTWTHAYTFSISSPGVWMVQFLLFKAGTLSAPYRNVQFFVRVR